MKKIFTVFLFFSVFAFFATKAKNTEASLADHLVINELHLDSIVGAGGSYDDWIELYNPTENPIDVSGWSIQKQASTLTSTIYAYELSGIIPANSYFLLVRNNDLTDQSLRDKADIMLSSSFSLADNNIVYLVDNTETIEGALDINIVDFVGLGSAEAFEGTASIDNPSETNSVKRNPDGEDSDNNSIDFIQINEPVANNSETNSSSSTQVGGTVLLTVLDEGSTNVSPGGAEIVFQVNDEASVYVNYGIDSSYGQISQTMSVLENTTGTIPLDNLECGTIYHYSMFAENIDGTETHETGDASFETLPCGIVIDSLVMTKGQARAVNSFVDSWEWEFDLTVWDLSETTLKLKFGQWSGVSIIDAAANMRFSVDGGLSWNEITENNVYPETGVDVSGIDLSGDSGRQINLLVQMKLPIGTLAGFYEADYGILTE